MLAGFTLTLLVRPRVTLAIICEKTKVMSSIEKSEGRDDCSQNIDGRTERSRQVVCVGVATLR